MDHEVGPAGRSGDTSLDLNDLLIEQQHALRELVGGEMPIELRLEAGLPRIRATRARCWMVLRVLLLRIRENFRPGQRLVVGTALVREATGPVGELMLSIWVEDGRVGASGEALRPSLQSRTFWPPSAFSRRAPTLDAGGPTILLCEDHDLVRWVMQRALEGLGVSLQAVARPLDALAVLDRSDATIRLLITDVMLPDMSGVELARRFAVQSPGTRILFVSGSSTPPRHLEGSGPAGQPALLRKPFPPAQLLEHVRRLLET